MEDFKDTNLRSLLRQLRTDIAMAVDDSFPLVFGLADKNIITDQLQKVNNSPTICGFLEKCTNVLFSQDTLEKESREGIHKAMYSLLSWVLEQRRSIIRAFWSNLSKDYNLDSYPKLHKLIANLPCSTSVRANIGLHYNLSVGLNPLIAVNRVGIHRFSRWKEILRWSENKPHQEEEPWGQWATKVSRQTKWWARYCLFPKMHCFGGKTMFPLSDGINFKLYIN